MSKRSLRLRITHGLIAGVISALVGAVIVVYFNLPAQVFGVAPILFVIGLVFGICFEFKVI